MTPMAFRLRLAIAALVAMPGLARADDAPPPVVPTISPTVSASTIGDEAVAVSDDSLSDLRGGFALVQGNQTLSAVSTGWPESAVRHTPIALKFSRARPRGSIRL